MNRRYKDINKYINGKELRIFNAKRNIRFIGRKTVPGEKGDWILSECSSNGIPKLGVKQKHLSDKAFRKAYVPCIEAGAFVYKEKDGIFPVVSAAHDIDWHTDKGVVHINAGDYIDLKTMKIISARDFALNYIDMGTVY